ncbi:MAG: hypothetical protein HY319_09015 [Armatimonadetes bacterium]|nr:hypothetical protein [Armatimonadota bacterium]
MKLEQLGQRWVARSVQYVLRFRARSNEELAAMLQVIDERFTARENDPGYPQSWTAPDVRITGSAEVSRAKMVLVNILEDGRVLTLSREALGVVESQGQILVNELLWNYIE